MATASISRINDRTTLAGLELVASCDVRVWGMDTKEKPFIQAATARHMTEKGALLTGILPVKYGDMIGVKYLDRKGRFKVTWVSDPDPAQTRSVGVDCLEDVNFFGVRKQPIPIEATSALYSESKMLSGEAPPNRRKAERFNCRVAADVALDNSVAQSHASVTDISRNGCYLQMVSPFPVGSSVGLSIYAKDLPEPLIVRGVVRTSHPMVGMGVEFSDVSIVDIQAMHVVLQQLGGPKPVRKEQRSAACTEPRAIPDDTPPEAFPMAIEIPSPRVAVMQISAELQRLEADSHALHSAKLTEELRQAAMHVKNAQRLCPAE